MPDARSRISRSRFTASAAWSSIGARLKHPLALRLELEQPLLHLGAEVDPGGDLEGDRFGVQVELLELRLGALHDAVVRGQALRDLLLGRLLAVVVQLADLGRRECAALGQLHESEALPALDDDVQAPVRESLHNLDHPCPRAHLAHPVVVREHEPELLVSVQAFADQLPVARLEDVQGRLLAREEHEVQREETDLAHC